MRETWNAAGVGLMVVLGLLAMFAVYRYVDERTSSDSGYQVHAYFEDVQGLIRKSRVLVAGIPVGYIEKISLDGARARVDLRIDSRVALHEDARVATRSISLLGERILVIHPGSKDLPVIEDGGEIISVQEGVQTDDILVTVSDIADSVKNITKQMERAFGTDEAGTRMESALQNLSEALEGINRTIQTNEESVNRSIASVERILEHVELATENVSEIINTRRDDIDRGVSEVDDAIVSIRQAADQLTEVLEDFEEVSDRTARGEGTLGRLTQDEALIDEVEGVAEGLGDLVGGIARLRTIVEIRSEYNFLRETFKTYFSLILQPREGRYFLFQLVDDPRGSISVTNTLIQRSPPFDDQPGTFEETRITRTERLRFTAQFAKRIRFATFRIGIMESTGGLGLDLHLFRERLEFNTDLFAFGDQSLPRLRIRGGAEIVKRFWVVGGVYNLINSINEGGKIEGFLGLQLRFNDEDLKGLLPFAGAVSF